MTNNLYFRFNPHTIDQLSDRIPIADFSIVNLINRIELGENLFKIIPELKNTILSHYPLGSASFEKKIEDNEFTQLGSLMIPHYLVLTREKMGSSIGKRNITAHEFNKYHSILKEFPKQDIFYWKGVELEPLIDSYVLRQNQI